LADPFFCFFHEGTAAYARLEVAGAQRAGAVPNAHEVAHGRKRERGNDAPRTVRDGDPRDGDYNRGCLEQLQGTGAQLRLGTLLRGEQCSRQVKCELLSRGGHAQRLRRHPDDHALEGASRTSDDQPADDPLRFVTRQSAASERSKSGSR
jgi:hypothetical protein